MIISSFLRTSRTFIITNIIGLINLENRKFAKAFLLLDEYVNKTQIDLFKFNEEVSSICFIINL